MCIFRLCINLKELFISLRLEHRESLNKSNSLTTYTHTEHRAHTNNLKPIPLCLHGMDANNSVTVCKHPHTHRWNPMQTLTIDIKYLYVWTVGSTPHNEILHHNARTYKHKLTLPWTQQIAHHIQFLQLHEFRLIPSLIQECLTQPKQERQGQYAKEKGGQHMLAPPTADTENSRRCTVNVVYEVHSSKHAVLQVLAFKRSEHISAK
jgi:hypothetical protein